MKKIIKKKVYDTDTATLVASVPHPNCYDSTGQICEQELYLKKNGEYFLYLRGARSDAVHNIRIEDEPHDKGRNIYVLPYNKAREWGEQELTAEQWLELFEPVEDDSKSQIHVYLKNTVISKLKKTAQMQGVTLSALIESMTDNL